MTHHSQKNYTTINLHKRGFAHLFLAVVIVLIGLGGLLYFSWQKGLVKTAPEETSLTPTSNPTKDWKLYSRQEISFQYPPTWKEKPIQLTGSGSYLEIENESGIFTFIFTNRGNYNNGTEKPYSSLQEYTNMPYPGVERIIDGQEAMQYLPRAGSENVNSVYFFSKDQKQIYTIELTTNVKTEEQIEKGQKLFDQIISTFKFLDTNDVEKDTISQFLGRWDNLQKNIPFKPVLGGAGWFVDYFQFMGNNTFLVSFEDGHVLHAAIHKKQDDQFTLMESFENIPFKSTEWNSLEEKYGDQKYTVTTYGKGGDKNSSEWIKISDNIFIE